MKKLLIITLSVICLVIPIQVYGQIAKCRICGKAISSCPFKGRHLQKPKPKPVPKLRTSPPQSKKNPSFGNSQNKMETSPKDHNSKEPVNAIHTHQQTNSANTDEFAGITAEQIYEKGSHCYYSHKDYEKALKYYRKSAEQGSAKGQAALGWMYYEGKGVSQSDTEAVKWWRKAAEQGDNISQSMLGWMYYAGKGVSQSDIEAVKWCRKAAEQGNANAQYNLGIMYYAGKGVSQSDTEAVKWYKKAAEQGLSNAQYNLGVMYANGTGVSQDDVEAVKWYQKAAEQGNEYVKDALKSRGYNY